MIFEHGQRPGLLGGTFGRTARGLTVAVLLALFHLSAPAEARTANTGESHGGKKAEAKAEFEKAQLHYRLGRFEEALKSYTRAYELFNAPALLFNIGQCHKNLQNHERAIFFFEGYLREETNAEKRALAEELIAASRTQLQRQRLEALKSDPGTSAPATANPAVPPPPAAEPTTPVATTPPPAPLPGIVERPPAPPVLVDSPPEATPTGEERPIYQTWWFWTALGAGAAAVATGAAIYYATGPTKTQAPLGTLGTLDRR